MASPNDGRETDRKTFLERKKEVFEETKEADEKLWKIRQEEMAEQKRQQQQNEIEYLRRTLESVKVENAALKRDKQTKSLDDMTLSVGASATDNKIERFETELSCMKKKIAVCEREHGRADGGTEMREELKALRHQNIEQSVSVTKLKDAMQRIISYSKTQEKEKEQALREVASLRDEISALRQISAETQQRQLNEIQSSSSAMKQHEQQRTGNFSSSSSCFINFCVSSCFLSFFSSYSLCSLRVRVVEWLSHSTVVQEVPGSYSGAAAKCWAVMELFVNIYLYEFVLCLVCERVRCFGLY